MQFSDALTLDAPRRTSDGYMAVRARAARAGVYEYLGREVDPEGKTFAADERVPVYRPADEVFSQASVHSFLMKPITDDHPSQAVTAANWRDHARGTVAKAMRDGDHLAFDLVLMDRDAIAAVDTGKRELSNGYSCDLKIGDGTAPDGTTYRATQTNIVGNHVALVKAGRAGPSCRIGDAALCDAVPRTIFDKEKPVKNMLIDGLTVDIANADTAEATIKTLLAARDTATGKVAGLETQVATLTTDKATLEQKLAGAAVTPQQLRDAAKAYALTAGRAKALGIAVTDAMSEAEIMAAAVKAKMGDAATGWTDAQIAASFAVLAKDAKVQVNALDAAIQGQPVSFTDAAAREAAALGKANDHNSWRTAAKAA